MKTLRGFLKPFDAASPLSWPRGRRSIVRCALPVLFLAVVAAHGPRAGAAPADSPAALERRPNTTLRLPASEAGAVFPQTLDATGAFADLATLTPHEGIVPYDLNVPLWSDGAHKQRWFSLPDANLTFGFRREGNWTFPTGAIWMKHFELELTNGVPASRRRLETRFLVRTTNGVYGLSYRWDEAQTNATLVAAGGASATFTVNDGGALRSQTWRYPARNQCLSCHNAAAGYVLGFNTAQLNREMNYDGRKENQIRVLSAAGYFEQPVTGIHSLRVLAGATNTAFNREYRVRSWLAANCAYCHLPGATCPTPFNPQLTNALPATQLVEGLLLNNLGDPANRVVKPGDPGHSVLLQRISNPSLRMPPLATSVLDTQAIALVTAWITEDLPRYQNFPAWQAAWFGSTNAPAAAPSLDTDGDGAPNHLEYLTRGNPLTQDGNPWKLVIRRTERGTHLWFPRMAGRGYEVEWTRTVVDRDSWQPLEVPDNCFIVTPADRMTMVNDPEVGGPMKFYRVRMFEP